MSAETPIFAPAAPGLRLERLAAAAAQRVAGMLPLIVLVVAWEALARAHILSAFLLPPLTVVLDRVWDDVLSGDLLLNLGVTLYRAMAGFAIAAVAGVALGIVMARNAAVRWFFDPIVSVGFPMPKIAFLPIFMLWLGLYDVSKISMVVFNAIFPVIPAPIPAALPQILTGLQVALPISLIVEIVTEMLMGGTGLGGAMIGASRFADSPGVFAGIVEIAIAGLALVKGIAIVRRHLLVWHQEAEEPTTV